MKVLGIDTSTKTLSVAICDDDKIICENFINSTMNHSCTLIPTIDNLLVFANLKISDIDLFVTTSGPGSFTGIRIGISTVKGFAWAMDKPCIAISSLEALAFNLIDTDCIACPVIDARGDRVYTSLFKIHSKKLTRLTDDNVILINELQKKLLNTEENIIFLGDGADLCYNIMKQRINSKTANSVNRLCRASSVCMVGKDKYKSRQISSAYDIVPQYINLSQAERERNEKIKSRGEKNDDNIRI